jgi:hypothetical protein
MWLHGDGGLPGRLFLDGGASRERSGAVFAVRSKAARGAGSTAGDGCRVIFFFLYTLLCIAFIAWARGDLPKVFDWAEHRVANARYWLRSRK